MARPNKYTYKYGLKWLGSNPVDIEIYCIRKGGSWTDKRGNKCGEGLFHHFKSLQSLLRPSKKWHRWNELLLKSFIENQRVGIMGCGSSGKTSESSDWAFANYVCWPNETSILISSTDMRSLELRIWGELKQIFSNAKEKYPDLPGNIVESKKMIVTEGAGEVRDFRNGIIGIPTVASNGRYVGIGKFIGIKNKRMIQIGDELPLMDKSFLESMSNLSKNPWYQFIGMGNPVDRDNPLIEICEPASEEGGWASVDFDDHKTKTWKTKYPEGIAINLIGVDCPNFDVSETDPIPFPFLIKRKDIENDLKLYGRDSAQFMAMNLGIPPTDPSAARVITRTMVNQHEANQEPVWNHEPLIKVAGLDAAYSGVGGDRCIFCELHLGHDTNGNQILAYHGKPLLVPVKPNLQVIPEDQIAEFVMKECIARGIPPENVGFDATGKGSLGTSFARIWSSAVNPIEFGGKPTEREVSKQIKVPCSKHYFNFVTELWYAVRYAIMAGQVRGLPEEVIYEGCMREWSIVGNNKIQIEPKDLTKKRMGRSPDIFDSFVISCEMARRKGFSISRVDDAAKDSRDLKWLYQLRDQHAALKRRNTLVSRN